MISSFQAFDLFQVMTDGRPGQDQTRALSLDIYENAFRYQRMGWAAAVSLVLLRDRASDLARAGTAAADEVGVLTMATDTGSEPSGPKREAGHRRRAATASAPRRRGSCLYAVLLTVVRDRRGAAVRLDDPVGSFKTGAEIRQIPPTFCPQDVDARQLPARSCRTRSLPLRALLPQLAVRRRHQRRSRRCSRASLLGYIFAKFEFRGRQPLFWFLLATMMIPPQRAR